MAKKPIRPNRSDADYRAALVEIESYFENEPRPGTAKAGRFDLPATAREAYESKRWPIGRPRG